jgi:hypothetical protein
MLFAHLGYAAPEPDMSGRPDPCYVRRGMPNRTLRRQVLEDRDGIAQYEELVNNGRMLRDMTDFYNVKNFNSTATPSNNIYDALNGYKGIPEMRPRLTVNNTPCMAAPRRIEISDDGVCALDNRRIPMTAYTGNNECGIVNNGSSSYKLLDSRGGGVCGTRLPPRQDTAIQELRYVGRKYTR